MASPFPWKGAQRLRRSIQLRARLLHRVGPTWQFSGQELGKVIRAQERSENLYASIDLVANKLARQLKRYKDRRADHHHGPAAETEAEPGLQGDLTQGRTAALPAPPVRRKYFAMAPMTLDEALHQLDLIDHDFYLFRDRDSGELQVVYRRNHGGYGVIQQRA